MAEWHHWLDGCESEWTRRVGDGQGLVRVGDGCDSWGRRVEHDWATELNWTEMKNKGTFHAKTGTIKDRNGMDLIEAEDIKKRWQECTEELYKTDHNPDNHNGVITHLDLDILECEVKWTLGNITTNKASGGEFQLSYFKSQKMMLWKCCTQYASKFGKLSSGHRTGKGQFSVQSHRNTMPKNAQTTPQLHSSHMLVK